MVKESNKHLILLFAIFVFSFLYRFLLMTRGTFPSGADIGLHNSVIYSITQGGNVDFLYNNYQMGGGLSLTFPGYHIFAAQIMMMTGMPEYLVHAVVVSLVSSVVVLVSYLITRAVWRESAAFIVAFLVAVSRFDIEMLLWGGFPNVITLMLIPVTFYMYIQKDRFTKIPFYISTSLLVGSIFLAHSLSSVVFVSVLFSVIFLGIVFGQKIGTTRLKSLSWLLPVIFGAILVSPYLTKIVPAYLANETTAEINQATASTRILPYEIVVPLFLIVGLFFLLSKKYNKRYLTIPTILLVMWLLVPVIFTQGYIIGQYTDYNRFLYFVIMPVCILMGLFIDHGSGFFARIIVTYRTLTSQLNTGAKVVKQVTHKRLAKISNKISKGMTRKNLYGGFVLGLLLMCFVVIPVFMTPIQGINIQEFYQRMDPALYEAMEWAKTNTPQDATFVTEAYYGWWFAGFAQRPTWSAVDPQFLSLSREFSIAQTATNLLDTDYLIDNNLIQVRDDGYLARHNPEILTKLNWTYFPHSFFNFNSNQTKIVFDVNDKSQSAYIDELPVKEMRLENDTSHATIIVTRGNEFINYIQSTTVTSGKLFVDITITIEAISDNVKLTLLDMWVQTNGVPINYESTETIGLIEEGIKAFGQLIVKENQARFDSTAITQYHLIPLSYSLKDASNGQVQISAATYSVTDDLTIYKTEKSKEDFFIPIIKANLKSDPAEHDWPFTLIFDYQAALTTNNLNYIAVTDSGMRSKFANDPMFNLVFINNEVAIFEVKK